MNNEKYDCYLIKHKDGKLLKFCYDNQMGIYYQILIKQKWSEKKSIYKESFSHFCVLENENGLINVFCQDICGNIVLCTLEEKKWNYKVLLHMKCDIIMPVYIRAFFSSDNIHLLYNIVDKYTYSEGLVHQFSNDSINWSNPQMVSKLDYYRLPYRIFQDCKSNLVILNTMLSTVYQLTCRNFHATEGKWGKEEVIHTSFLPYIDFTFCAEGNRKHYLFITQDDQVNKVIYQYKEIDLQKNTVLFQNEKIDSCLLILFNSILWALWICENKLYGCFSTNYGRNFSSPRVYKCFDNKVPVKGFYQEYPKDKSEMHIAREIYVINLNGEEELFLQELLQNLTNKEVNDEESLKNKLQDGDCQMEELKECFNRLMIAKKEKEELEKRFKSAEVELIRLNETIEYQKNQISALQYQFYREKEKNKLYIQENNRLKEKNDYLEKKLLLNNKEKILLEKKLTENREENEMLKQEFNLMQNDDLQDFKRTLRKSSKENSRQSKFSLINWLFSDENN